MSKLNTNGFDKNPQNINRKWRPKKGISAVNAELQKKGYEPAKKSEIENIYLQIINLPEEKINELIKDTEQPMLVRIVCRNMMNNKTGFDIIERMLDRSVGKSVETIKQTHEVKKVEIEILQPDPSKFSAPTSIQDDNELNEHNEN